MDIKVLKGDITRIPADAIVNAANSSLMGGGGVDGAIHRAGGPEILAECCRIVEKQGSCPTGEAVITGAGKLPARYVIHTVGPVWHGGSNDEPRLLARCYTNSLSLAEQNSCRSVAFPNISTGVYRYPKNLAARVAVKAIRDFAVEHPATVIESVHLVCFDEESYLLLSQLLR